MYAECMFTGALEGAGVGHSVNFINIILPSCSILAAPAAVAVLENPSRKHNYILSRVLRAYAECMFTGALGSTEVTVVIMSGSPFQ